MKQIATLLLILLSGIYHTIHAQQFAAYPSFLVEKKTFQPSVSFYIPASNNVMVLQNGQYQLYNLNGKPITDAVTIVKQDGDLRYPSVSRSGKKIMFYQPAADFLKKQEITVFDTETFRLLGSFELPYFEQIDRTRFLGDSLLNIYSHEDGMQKLATWNLNTSKLKNNAMFEDKEGFIGTPDINIDASGIQTIYRKWDTLALVNFRSDRNYEQYYTTIQLPTNHTSISSRYSDGYPYSIITNPALNETRFYSAPDSTFIEHAVLKAHATIIAAEGSKEHCYLLFIDSTKRSPTLQLFDAVQNSFIQTQIPSSYGTTHFSQIHIENDLLICSNRINGTMQAFKLSTGAKLWDFIVKEDGFMLNDTVANTLPTNLFKVMMKQGSNDVADINYDQKNNQLLLIKNNQQLVTVDATSESAIKWEYFYSDLSRSVYSKLLPGFQYIHTTVEHWKKDPTNAAENLDGKLERDENLNAKNHIYPHGFKIYDRQKGEIIFDVRMQTIARYKFINDSLLAWSKVENLYEQDSIYVMNLHTGNVRAFRPAAAHTIVNFEVGMHHQSLMFLSSLTNNTLILTNENNHILFSKPIKNASPYDTYGYFSSHPDYFYYHNKESDEKAICYRIYKDTVQLVGKMPANIEIKTSASVKDQLYFLYSKKIAISPDTEVFEYRLYHVNSGSDKLIEKVSGDNHSSFKEYQIFPSDGYYTEANDGRVLWKALNNGYDIKEFGRYEHSISSITYSADGRYLAAGSTSGEVLLWDLGTGKETKTLRVGQNGLITKLAFSGDGKYIAASSGDIWETASGKNVVSVTDGDIWNVNSIDFSSDGKRIVSAGACIISWDASDGSRQVFHQYPNKSDMDTLNMGWNPNGYIDPAYRFMAYSTSLHPNSKDFVVGNKSGIVQKWNTEDDSLYAGKILSIVPTQTDNTVYDIKYTKDGKHVIAIQEKMIYKLNGVTLAVEDSLQLNEDEKILGIDVDHAGEFIGCISRIGKKYVAQLRSFSNLKVVHSFTTDGASFNKISFSPNKKHLATASDDGFCTIWDYRALKPVMYLNSMGSTENVMVTPDNYYMASKAALEGVNFFKDGKFYSFDQFDMYLNRPDIVLNRLGYANEELVQFYRTAYLKRLKKLTGNINDTIIRSYVPDLLLSNRADLPKVFDKGIIPIALQIKDTAFTKGKLKIFVNGNLVQTKHFTASTETTLLYKDSILLTQGQNNVDIVYSDHASVESRKEKLAISFAPEKPLPSRVWYFGIGISDYKIKEMNLRYPVKDIRDMAKLFKKKYPNIVIDTLLNEQATKENILALRNKLMQTSIEDKVIISFSGHGLLSDSLNWYFASAGVDFQQPEKAGLAYDQMEGLLDGIPARKKLLLLDACHSGDVDKEADITLSNATTEMDSEIVSTDISTRGNVLIGKSKAGLQTSFEMMQELFTNLSYGNGTTVLSAAGGREFALESDEWKNGVFTFSLLKSLQTASTDKDGNKKISVRELKEAVFEKVRTLTGGRQKPTSRVEVLDDWYVWE